MAPWAAAVEETIAAAVSLTRIAPRLVGLGSVDVGPGGAVDDRVGAQLGDRVLDRGGVGDVELGARQARRPRGRAPASASIDVAAEHPAGACDQAPSREPDLRVVADDHPQRLRQPVAARELHVAAEQARLDPRVEVADARPGEQDRVLDLGADDLDVAVDRGVRADVGVDDAARRRR